MSEEVSINELSLFYLLGLPVRAVVFMVRMIC